MKLNFAPNDAAKWPGGKKAAFALMFDDSVPSHVQTVIPELQKRGMSGTFYVNPGKNEWQNFKTSWESEIPSIPGMVYANHTLTHRGCQNFAEAEAEIAGCNAVIERVPPSETPRLRSFRRPGGPLERWNISEDELQTLLTKYHLIERAPFAGHGAMDSFHTAEAMLGLVDRAIKTGTFEYLVFHGVGADWLRTPRETFISLLDGLEERRRDVWITDHISAFEYETARKNA